MQKKTVSMRLYLGIFSIALFIVLIDFLFYLIFLHKKPNSVRWFWGSAIFSFVYVCYWIWLFLSSPEQYSYLEADNYYLFFIATSVIVLFYIPRLLAIVLRLVTYAFELLRVLRRKTAKHIALVMGGVVFILVVLGIFVIRFQFRVIEQNVKHESVPVSFDNYRIVQISDLHLGTSKYQKNQFCNMVEQINSLNPDLVVFTGDIVNNFATELEGWDTILRSIQSKDGIYAILGNHDYGDYVQWLSPLEKQRNFKHIVSFFDELNWKLLLNEYDLLVNQNDTLVLSGVENWGHPPFPKYGDLDAALPDTLSKPVILLTHDPSHWDAKVKEHKADIFLTLSGHTHGFQFGVRSKNFNWSPVHFKYDKWGGMYQAHNRYLYVNIGAGTIGFPGRVGMRPEITLIKLQKKMML